MELVESSVETVLVVIVFVWPLDLVDAFAADPRLKYFVCLSMFSSLVVLLLPHKWVISSWVVLSILHRWLVLFYLL